MRIEVHNRCTDFTSYRAARVKSLFNVDTGANFEHTADLPIDDNDWKVGLVVGPSGSGKTSIGRRIFGDSAAIYQPVWPGDVPLRRHHARHHADAARNFGVTTSWIDRLLGTRAP